MVAHLTHGKSVNVSGKWFKAVHYTLDQKTERIDMAEVRKAALEHKPKLIITGRAPIHLSGNGGKIRRNRQKSGPCSWPISPTHRRCAWSPPALHRIPFGSGCRFCHHDDPQNLLRGPRAGMTMCKADWAKKIDSAVFPGLQGGPLMHIIAAKAAAFGECLRPEFKTYSAQILKNARTLAEEFSRRNYRLVTGGTDNHLMLIDLRKKDPNLTGAAVEGWLQSACAGIIIVNKNMVPFDTRKAMETSGIRVGTPALTTRGLKEAEMKNVAGWFDRAVQTKGDAGQLETIRAEVEDFTRQFPLPHVSVELESPALAGV